MASSTSKTSTNDKSFHSLNFEETERASLSSSSDSLTIQTNCSNANANIGKIQASTYADMELAEYGKTNDNTSSLLTQTVESNCGFDKELNMTKYHILKNLGVICTSFFLLFSSFNSLSNLQSSINKEEGIGTFSLATVYVGMTISSMFLASIFMDRFGLKLSMSLAMVMYVVYMAANLYPVWGIMVPAALLCGLAGGPLWASQSAFVSQLSKSYAKATNMKPKDSLSYLFGIFYMCVNAGKVTGNVIASLILRQDKLSNRSMTKEEIEDCMANKQEAVDNATTLERPDNTTIYLICGTWIGVAIVGILVLAFLTSVSLDRELSTDHKRKPICSKFLSTIQHFWNSRFQKLMMPITLYYGLSTGFLIADFTKSVVGCTFGIDTVSDVMICHGICNAVFSGIIGRLVKNFGHMPFFTLSFMCYSAVQVILIAWKPGPEDHYVVFLFVGMWGVADAIIKSQNLAVYGHLFMNNTEAAFSNYFVFDATGFIISFSYSTFVSTDIKLYILLGLLVCSATSYYTVEYIDRKHNARRDKDIDNVNGK